MFSSCHRWLYSPVVRCIRHAARAAAAPAAPPVAPAVADPLAWEPTKGVTVEQSLQADDYFKLNRLVNMQQLMEHRVHFGHKSGCRSEWMTPHLFGCRCDVDIIDLEQTAPLMRRALNFTAHVAARGGIVMFVWQGWPALGPLVERRVRDMGEFSYTRPWADQTLTNAGNYFNTATRLPDLVVFLSCLEPTMLPHPAINICAKVLIPTVGICDSNADPRLITFPVPGNDDSPQAIRLYLALFAEAIRRGKAAFADWSAPAAGADPAPSGDAFRQVQARELLNQRQQQQENGDEQKLMERTQRTKGQQQHPSQRRQARTRDTDS